MTYKFNHDGGNKATAHSDQELGMLLKNLFKDPQKLDEAAAKLKAGGTVKRMGWTIRKE